MSTCPSNGEVFTVGSCELPPGVANPFHAQNGVSAVITNCGVLPPGYPSEGRCSTYPNVTTLTTVTFTSQPPTPQVHGGQPRGSLPFTGGDALGLSLIGIACIIVGVGVLRLRRMRERDEVREEGFGS